jgi:hypothetical protein
MLDKVYWRTLFVDTLMVYRSAGPELWSTQNIQLPAKLTVFEVVYTIIPGGEHVHLAAELKFIHVAGANKYKSMSVLLFGQLIVPERKSPAFAATK